MVQGGKGVRQIADDLSPAGVPQRNGIQHGAGSERGDEAVDVRQCHQNAVQQAVQSGKGQHRQYRHLPRKAVFHLQGDGQDMPQHDAETDVEVNFADDHRDGRRQCQQRNLGFAGEDCLQRQHGRERRCDQRK
ncbi:hypothetical protein D3C80_950550 [compost metagenome]